MKLKKLNIDSYRHLQNIKFDFTYPEEHAKAGEPLEKICIIGQSATGKTSILELIKSNTELLRTMRIINGKHFADTFQMNFQGVIDYIINNENIQVTNEEILKDSTLISGYGASGTLDQLITKGIKLLYLSSELISGKTIEIFNQNPINILDSISNEKYLDLYKKENYDYIYELVQDVNTEIWFKLLYSILDYRKRFTQLASEVINKGALADINKLAKEFSRWSETNMNPLEAFAKQFNPILKKLNLEVDLINTEYSIPLKLKRKDEVIPIKDLSTGTKGLLLAAFPLFQLDTSDAVILIDEPERSLFPDMQIDLINHYKRLAPKAQFIVTTHSPFIAAAFEPEERFVLYFKEDGHVDVRRGTSPIGDDPNDILRNDFNVDYYNEFGKQAYQKYLELKTQVFEEKDKNKKKNFVIEMAKLGDKYNF